MYSSAKQALLLAALLMGMMLAGACENELKKINALSAKQFTSDIDSTTNVDIIYSDSARVKLHTMAPLLLQHKDAKHPEKDYDRMPHGVKIVFYDTTRKESGTIVADSAIQYYTLSEQHIMEKLIAFHGDVVAVNAEGKTYRSEELIWNLTKKIIYSTKMVQITGVGGDVMNGIDFTSDDKLMLYHFGHPTGIFHVADSLGN